jgi:murE/murF fusion protein
LHKNLQTLSRKKVNYVILEASSHGLHQKRINSLRIKTGIFTNLSHDHLDYHKSMKSYLNAKMYLFNFLLDKNSTIVTDEEIKEYKTINNISKRRKIKKNTIGINSGTIKILDHKYKDDKQIIRILIKSKTFLLEIPLIGYFQIKNLLMAILASFSCGLNPKKVFKYINKIKPVPGRLECVANLNNNSSIIVDFAHTPDALEQTLIAIKKHFKKKIIIVFGCGGERDKKKRLIMGKIAKKYCRKIFVTDDNPRNEDPKKIRNSIIKGCKSLAVNIGNRKKAINLAISELKPNELLLVAGKGHEIVQDYGKKIFFFSDKKAIKKIIKNKRKSFFYPITQKVFVNNLKNLRYDGVSISTKTIKKNNLFFAIKGKNNDGHKFVNDAIKKGANKVIISKKVAKVPKNKIVKVKNTFFSLNNLAKITRGRTAAKIIAVTGSAGKTTLKNLISFALENYGKVYHSPYSYNNKFGVPLSLCNIKSNTEYGVFEIGMDKKGEINNLSKLVKPQIAIINNISEAHIKNFKSIKDIAKAKAEIINNVQVGGSIILNKDDSFFSFFYNIAKKKDINIYSFSSHKYADIFLAGVKKKKKNYTLKVSVNDKIIYFDISNFSNSLINNILACISVLFALNLDLKNMKNLFKNFIIPKGRGDISKVNKFKKNFMFIDESYNANPLSMTSAIKNMKYYDRKKEAKKIVLLGDMLELGKRSRQLHKKLSNIINKSDIDLVFVYGKYIKETFKYLSINKKGLIFNDLKEAYNHLGKILHNNDLLMIKGSNASGLNQFSENFKKR